VIACPTCGRDSTVYETRSVQGGSRRRRICSDVGCGKRFTTIEVAVPGNQRWDGPIALVKTTDLDKLRETIARMAEKT
jgi:transcriptional regulator NrdR family protein